MTGFYQEKTSGNRPRYTMQINQAGSHVRVWVRQVLHAGYGESDHLTRRWRYWGRRPAGADDFRLFTEVFRWDCRDGALSGPPHSLTFRGSGVTGEELPQIEFERCKLGSFEAAGPVMPDRVRELLEAQADPASKKLAAQEYYRLPAYDVARLAAEIDEPALWEELRGFLDTPRYRPGDSSNEAWKTWNERVLALDNYVAVHFLQRMPRQATGVVGRGAPSALPPSNGSRDSWHPSDEDTMRAVTATMLDAVRRERSGESGTLLGWLQRAVMSRDNSSEHPLSWPAYEDFVATKFLLGISHSRELRSEPYAYRFDFLGIEAKIPVPEFPLVGGAAYAAAVRVHEDDVLLARLTIIIAGATAGASLSVGDFQGSYEATSITRWAPQEFAGHVTMLEAGSSYGAGGVGGGAKVGAILVHGNGSHQPLVLDRSGVSFTKPKKIPDKVKVGFSHGATAGTGYLWDSTSDDSPPKFFESEPEEVVDAYFPRLDERQRLFFMEGDALLTHWGRQVLGMFCCEELRMLQSAETQIQIIGYTDPEGSEQSNKELSGFRASNTLQAFYDALGSFQAEVTKVDGLGELPARTQGHVRNGAEDPLWRTVHIIMGDTVRLQLRAPRWRKKRG